MESNIREKYKAENGDINKVYTYLMGLKNNPEFEARVGQTFMAITQLLKKMYPNISIEAPRGRIKSDRSLKIKLEDLEIERLCKLHALNEINENEKHELCENIIKSIKQEGREEVEQIIFGDIKNLQNLYDLLENKKNEIPEKTTTALLRITESRLRNEPIKNSENLREELNKKYGEEKVKETKLLKDDLLKWNKIENMPEKEKNLLHDSFHYLKSKIGDLLGIKLIIADVPVDMQTNNEKLKELLNRKKQAKESDDNIENTKTYCNDLCALEVAREFADKLAYDEEILRELNLENVERKHKEKQNGYRAEHAKFSYIDHPEYVFELQLRTVYREELSRLNGPASHSQRSGKKRVFPDVTNKKQFVEKIRHNVPRYMLIKMDHGELKLHKCTLQESMLEFLLGYELSEEDVKLGMQYLNEEEENEK